MLRQEKEKFTQKWTMNVHLSVVQKTHSASISQSNFFSRTFFWPGRLKKKKSLLKLMDREFIWFPLMVSFRLKAELGFKKPLHYCKEFVLYEK